MQPRPMAETSRPRLPSFRFCIACSPVFAPRRDSLARSSGLVLSVADLLHPVDDLAVQRFLNGDMGHGCGWSGAVPVLLAGREPDHVTRPDFLHRAAFALDAAATGRDDQRLTQRMRMPGRAGAGLERDAGAANTCRVGCLEQR